MWRRVALSSKETLEQLISYQAAIEALNSPSNEWLKVDYLIEFGQWLYCNEFPLQDAIDQIEWAVDIMLNMKTETELKKEATKKTDSKRNPSKAAAAAASKKAEKKGGAGVGKGKGSAKPKGPPATPKPRSAESRTKTPDKSSDGRSETSDGESELTAEGIVPVVKQAIIGVLPANSALTISDLEDVRQLDGLIRAHVLLAEISGMSSEYYKDYLLMSQAYLMRLLQVTIGTSGPTMKEIAKNPPAPVDSGKKDGSAKGKKKGEKEKEVPVKEKPKRKGPLDHIPSNTEDWAVYDCPDEVMDAFRHEMMKTTGINNNTISKPMLTMHYLDELIKRLRDIGYNHLALPILVLEDILSRDVLKNAPLNMSVHSKAAEVCLELNLKSGCNFHEKLAGPMVLNEDDQALSRDEIALWKEKQIQVAKEEVRGKESLMKAAEESKASEKAMSKMRSTVPSNLDLQTETPVESHLGKVLGAVNYRDVWTDIAELLIKQCHYQSAREFLNEAYSAALAFDDSALQSHILYLFGKLALVEAQFGQAFNFAKSAQENFEGDEMFWFNTTMLMVEATLNDYENRTNKRIARGILVHCLNEFARIAEERKNRACITGYIVGMLEAKLASIQISIIFSEHDDINVPKVMKRILSACQKYESSTEKLIRLGYKREVLPIMKEHSKVLRQMAGSALETEIRHTYYLQSMMVLKEACCLAEEVLHDVQTLTTLHETRNISLPVQRELADIMIECGEVMLEIFKEYSKEVRNKQLEDQRKGSVVKMVEDYIRATPLYTHMEKEWVDATKTVGEDALLKFVAAHNLSSNIPKLKSRALSGIGRMLLAFSMYVSPDPETQWIVHEMELIKLEYQTEENENKPKENPESKNYIRYSKQIKQMNDSDDVSRHYMLQASECMIQALNLALQKHYTDVASTVSLELVNCLGQYDPQASSQFLALYQSCSTSQTLEILLSRAQLDPMTSRLAALLHQRSCIVSNDITTNMSCGSLMTSVEHALEQEWEAWKKLDVKTNHLELLKDFPSNFNFLILQHSPDRNYLYGAVLDRPKSAPAITGKGKAPPVPSGPSRAKVFGVETSPELLDELLEKFTEHRQSVQQLLLKQEYQRAQAMMREKMLKNLDEDLIKKSKHFVIEDDAEEEAKLQEEFRELVNDMETYLKPITCQFEGLFTPQIITPASGGKDAKAAEPQAPQEYVIMLADPLLLQMPLEALEFLQNESIVSLSRDFSLQVFHHRFYKEEPTPAKPEEAEKKKKEAKSMDNPMSRIPGLRDASKKQAKIVPINRDIPHYCQGVDTMNFRYIVDPHLDCAETELNKPIEVFNKIVEEYESQFTPRWLGVLGDEHAPSVGEWEIYLVENSGFIFYGMERFLNYIPPAKLSALNIPECTMVYILDMAQTSKSFTRQSKVDVLKSANILALEKPVETMMLISLAGVKSVMANQWFGTLAENAQRLNDTMKDA
ncbi:hypothetical protein KUTeg_005485 [Tegillarca granosa]|uniref:Cilia- and flagella-associated protein 46 n=1 Tax=Tegillarca granosa TaxID=220873 RepID=A0ABQ9FLI8_TEGGR|nr:hypothetical protein KUTeg_005485 [Tegillarca granosa]